MNYLITLTLCLLTLLSSYASEEETYNSYNLEISEEMARDIEDFALYNFGDLESIQFGILTDNDNFMHGLGALWGMKNEDALEGDDRGKTFAMSMDVLLQYERAEVAIQFFSDLYSNLATKAQPDGGTTYLNQDGFIMTENTNYEGLRVKITRDLENRYFLSFLIEAAREEDTGGIAGRIQTYFHQITSELGNKEYDFQDYSEGESLLTSGLGLGKTFTLYNSDRLKIENRTQVGFNLSTNEAFRAAFVESSLSLTLGRSEFRFYGRHDTQDNYKYGAEYKFQLYQGKRLNITSTFGAYQEDNQYNRRHPDDHLNPLVETQYGGKFNDIIYNYRLDFTYNFK